MKFTFLMLFDLQVRIWCRAPEQTLASCLVYISRQSHHLVVLAFSSRSLMSVKLTWLCDSVCECLIGCIVILVKLKFLQES